jgi:hypothetical protein
MQLPDSDDQVVDFDTLPVLPPGSVPSLTPPETPPPAPVRKRLKNNAVLDQRVQVRIPLSQNNNCYYNLSFHNNCYSK